MTATLAIAQVTARNVLGLRRLIGFGLLAVFPGAIFFLVSRQATDFGKAENFTGMSLAVFLPVVVPIISIVVSAAVLGSERRGSTMSFLMLRPMSRFAIAAAKLGAAVVASFAINGVGALVLGTLGSLALGDFGYLTALLAGTSIATIGYAAVFMPVGYLTERSTLIGFIYIFVWEAAVAGIIVGLSGTSLWRIAASGFAGVAPSGLNADLLDAALGSLTAGAGGAVAKVVALVAISILFTGWLLRTRDLT